MLMPSIKDRGWHFKFLVIIFLLGASLRFIGIYPGHDPYHPDEGKAGYSSAWQMLLRGSLNPIDYTYPALFELASMLTIFLPAAWIKFPILNPATVINNLSNLNNIFPSLVIGLNDLPIIYWERFLTAFVSSLSLILTYLISKQLFKDKVASLFTMLILATNFRVVMNSHLDLPDIYNAFFLLIAFYLVISLIKHPSSKLYIFNGLTIGFAFSTKLQFFSFLPFF